MAASTTVSSHLAAPAARGLGEPDAVLLVGGSRFPVHAAVVSRGSGLLSQLLSEFGGSGGGSGGEAGDQPELRLFASAKAASSSSLAPAAALNQEQLVLVSDPRNFAAYLTRLYSPTGTAPLDASFDVAAAHDLLTLADFFDSPQLLPEIDNSLVATISKHPVSAPRLLAIGGYCGSSAVCTTEAFPAFFELARDFQLRRTMAEVLSVFTIGHLLHGDMKTVTKGCQPAVPLLDTLDAAPLAELVKLGMRNPAACSRSCKSSCSEKAGSFYPQLCPECKAALLEHRAAAVLQLERGLLERGWGYCRA